MSGKSVEAILGRIGHERGQKTERVLERVVLEAIEKGCCPEWLTGLEKTDGQDERRGIDFWAVTDVGNIALQVKSSRKGEEEARKNRPKIPVISFRSTDTEEEIFGHFVEIVENQREKYLAQRRDF